MDSIQSPHPSQKFKSVLEKLFYTFGLWRGNKFFGECEAIKKSKWMNATAMTVMIVAQANSGESIRIISAGKITPRERTDYEKENHEADTACRIAQRVRSAKIKGGRSREIHGTLQSPHKPCATLA